VIEIYVIQWGLNFFQTMIEYFLGMKFKKSIIKSMVEIKHWSIGHLNLFWKTTKFFWGIAQKNWSPTFSSQSC
jgi:hypothetical protein